MQLTAEQVSAAKAKEPRSKKVTIDAAGEIIEVMIRPPTRAEAKLYKSLANSQDEAKSAGANEQLLKWCCVDPDPKTADFATLIEQRGFLADTVASKIKELGGLTSKVELGE